MRHRLKREDYADFIVRAVKEDSPWMIDMRGGLSLLLLRDLEVDDNVVKSGLLIDFKSSLSTTRSGRLSPMILIRDGDSWRIIDSLWTLGRIAGGTVASAFSQNPSLLLDPLSSAAVARKALARIREIGVWKGEDPTEVLRSSTESSVMGERSPEEIRLALESVIDYMRDDSVNASGSLSILLGSWPVEEFRKQFSLGLEAVRVMEEEAQAAYDEVRQLVRVDEFVSLRWDEFNLTGGYADINYFISLGWIFYSFERSPSGEGMSREYYNELGRIPVRSELELDDTAGWKDAMVEGVKAILDEWSSKKREIIQDEPEISFKSETLSKMLKSALGEEYSLSGSLEGFF